MPDGHHEFGRLRQLMTHFRHWRFTILQRKTNWRTHGAGKGRHLRVA